MEAFVQILINGLSQGSVYALVALGYTMVYGVLQFINFAHSDIFMMGAFAAIFAVPALKSLGVTSPWVLFVLTTLASMLACIFVSLTVERIAYRPLRKAPRLNVLITAIGVSLFLQNFVQVTAGADPRFFPRVIETQSLLGGEGLVITNIQVMVLAVSAILMLLLNFIVHHTKLGTAMRAVSFDIEIANLMGIPTDSVISFTFIIGSALAGAASILYGLAYPKIEPLLGTLIGLKAFVAAVFGGIGSIMGATVGGLVLGLAEAITVYLGASTYRDAIAFGILILILLVKPAGLFGTVRREKV